MSVINLVLGVPLGYVLYFCYWMTGNYGASILLFTFLSKLILFPISLLVQKNSVKMIRLQPELDRIKRRYAGDKDRIAEEQLKLYEAEHYSPALGCMPMLLQIPFILGLISVIYNPLRHLLHFDAQTIERLVAVAAEILQTTELGSSPQMRVISLIANGEYYARFASVQGIASDVLERVLSLNFNFFGLNLSEIPSLTHLSPLLLVPVVSGVSALLLCVYQNRANVLQREQGVKNQIGMTIFLTAFSTYFTFIVPAGVGIYWIASNLLGIVQLAVLNRIYKPEKYIDYENRPKQPTPEERAALAAREKALKAREKADIKRFFDDANWVKQLVFYSERNGFYKYYERVVEYVLDHSNLTIHYVTSDPDDRIFDRADARILPYYVSDAGLASFMLKVDADMMVMTMPDLGQFHIKRSLARKDMEYIYMFHYPLSTTMVLRKGALDHYDTIFLVGDFQADEIRQTEALYGLPAKNLVVCGYGLLEDLRAQYEAMPLVKRERPKVLIAPSWQPDNLLDYCLDNLLSELLGKGFDVYVRPHPEYTKRYPEQMDLIVNRYAGYAGGDLHFELDFSDSSSIYNSDIVVTDWSGTAYEFAFVTCRPAVFVDTPPKVNNIEYDRIEAKPLEITLREEIGIRVQPDALEGLSGRISDLICEKDRYAEKIDQIFTRTIANFGRSGEMAGRYIIEKIGDEQHAR